MILQERCADDLLNITPYLSRVMFHPTRLFKYLFMLFLSDRNAIPSIVEYDETRTRGSLIN